MFAQGTPRRTQLEQLGLTANRTVGPECCFFTGDWGLSGRVRGNYGIKKKKKEKKKEKGHDDGEIRRETGMSDL